MRNLFSTPVRPPMDAVTRLKALQAGGLSEDEARRVLGRELDRPANGNGHQRKRRTLTPAPEIANLATPVVEHVMDVAPDPGIPTAPLTPVIANRFRPAVTPKVPRPKFDAVAYYSLHSVENLGQVKRPSGALVDVVIGYTQWPDSHANAKYNGGLHLAGVGVATINLSFDALAAFVALAPRIEQYLESHAVDIATAEANAPQRRREPS
jgi:hypothetical protein